MLAEVGRRSAVRSLPAAAGALLAGLTFEEGIGVNLFALVPPAAAAAGGGGGAAAAEASAEGC